MGAIAEYLWHSTAIHPFSQVCAQAFFGAEFGKFLIGSATVHDNASVLARILILILIFIYRQRHRARQRLCARPQPPWHFYL
jgi:hypothetical protein